MIARAKPREKSDLPIGMLIVQIKQRLKQRFMRNLASHGVTPAQVGVLFQLYAEDGLTPSEVAQRTTMDLPMLSRVVDRLVRGGLAERKRDDGDRRRVRVWTTDKARALA